MNDLGIAHRVFTKFLPCNLLGCLLLLSSCNVGPNYVRPKVQVPEHYKEAKDGWKIAEPQDGCDRGSWWTVFNDPELNKLEEQVALSNNTVAVAEAQYQQARALVAQARAGYFPTISHAASETRQKTASIGTSSSSTSSTTSGSGQPFTTYSTSLTASWEPDLWGSVGRQVESTEAGEQASEANLAAVKLSMQGMLAQTYFQLRALDIGQKFLDNTVDDYKKSLEITQNRYKQGVAAQLDIAQAQTQLETARVQAVDNSIGRAQFEHAIAVLIGQPPASFSIPVSTVPLVLPSIPAQLPSALLERRPDVAQAERQMQQMSAQIGVAVAAYFPVLTLAGTGGFNSLSFAKWFTAPAQFWSFGPSLATLLFDGGLRSAKVDAARAVYDQSVATYRQAVLAAFQDVEDNLVSLHKLSLGLTIQNQAVASAKLALKIVTNQYKSGTASYTDVVLAQTNVFTTERNAIIIASRQMVSAVGLIKALGGCWSVGDLHIPKSECKKC